MPIYPALRQPDNIGQSPGENMMKYTGSILFSFFFILSVIVITLLNIVFFPVPYRYRIYLLLSWAKFNLFSLNQFCGLSVEIEGRENIPETPCLVFSKHQSTLETIVLQLVFIPHVWVLKRELLWIPFFGWSLYLSKAIAIDRSSGKKAIKQIVATGTQRLKEKYWVIIFPEGTRTRPGDKAEYKIGGPILAAKSGYDIVPVSHNFGHFWPKGQFYKKPGKARLVIGAVIKNEGQSAKKILKQTEVAIESLCRE